MDHQIMEETKPFAPKYNLQFIIYYWPKGTNRHLQITQAFAKAIFCSPQTDGKALLVKTAPKCHIEHGEVKLVFI